MTSEVSQKQVMDVSIRLIKIGDRARKDLGDIASLAASIESLGLLQPIGIDSNYKLIFGERRLRAFERLGRDSIPARIVHVPLLLLAEHAENEVRKDFTPSERVAIAKAIEEEIGNRRGQRTDLKADGQGDLLGGGLAENFPEVAGKETRQIVAERAGFGNETTYRQAKTVTERAEPELREAMDRGEVAISTAAILSRESPEIQRQAAADRKKAIELAKQASAAKVREIKKTAGAEKAAKKTAMREERETRKAAAASIGATLPRESGAVTLHHASCVGMIQLLEPQSVDWIITDPPYPREFLPVYSDLAELAAHALKPGGLLLAMIGQAYLPDIVSALSARLTYHWTLAYLTPGGQAVQVHPRKVNAAWKPVLVYSVGDYDGRWFGDVAKSAPNDNDKESHHWGQSVSGMADLVSRFVSAGDVVLDPFVGGGTTGVVSVSMGAEFIGADIDESALNIAASRLMRDAA